MIKLVLDAAIITEVLLMGENEQRKITFLDTTLRDGEQAPGNAMNPDQKFKLALLLEEAGVETIETGFPASSKEDFFATKMISQKLTKASFATFSRALIKDVEIALEAGGVSDRHLIMMVATGSDLHLKNKRHITRERGLEEIAEAVKYAKEQGINNIAVGIEDASRGEKEYIDKIIDTSLINGANQIILADTTGYAIPEVFSDLIRFTRQRTGPYIKVSTHCHNDLGLAVVNSLAALKAGADEVQTTICGIGERAGNTSLEQVAAILHYKNEEYKMKSDIKLNKLYGIYLELKKCIGLEDSRMQPLFGKYVFSTAAGIHQQGMINNPDTYEYVKAKDLGRERKFFVDRHSGHSIIRLILKDLGLKVNRKTLDNLYEEYVLNNNDSCYEVDKLRNLIGQELKVSSE
jgi:2-isopropylmalate synthase